MSIRPASPRHTLYLALAALFACITSTPSLALITGGGSEPMPDRGWPLGSEKLANLPARVSWWEGPPFGGGEYHFEYTCKDTQEFNDALKLFAAIQIPKMTRTNLSTTGDTLVELQDRLAFLVVHDGPGSQQRFGQPADKKNRPINWTFTIWSPASWYHLFNHPKGFWDADHPNFRQPVPVPAIDVYVGKESPIEWAKVKVPQNVRVVDRRGKIAPGQTAQGGVIHGRVYDITTHRPIDDVEIILEPVGKESGSSDKRKGLTDQQGRFRIEKIPAGTFKVLAIEGGNYVSRQAGTYRNEGGIEMEAVVFMSPKAAITGTVLDVHGKPIRGVKVSASQVLGIDGLGYPLQSEVSDTTDEDGLFELTGLPKGCASLRCSAASLYQKASLELYDVPSDAITIVMTGTGIVRGKVIFKSGPPKGEIHVSIEPPGGSRVGSWGGSARCNPDGSFEFKGVPPGDYELSTTPAIVRQDDAGVVKITVKAGETVEVKLSHEERSGRSGKWTIMGPRKIAPPTTLPAVSTSLPFLLKSSSGEPAIVVYRDAAGVRRPSSDKSWEGSIIVEVWPDGQIAWSDNSVRGGPPYKKGSVRPERIAAVIESLAKDRVFDNGGLSRGYSGPDSDYLVIRVLDGSRQMQLASWHELFETKPNLVVTSKGVETLNQRNRADVLAAEPAEYRRFREVWDRIRQEVKKLTSEAGDVKPIPVE